MLIKTVGQDLENMFVTKIKENASKLKQLQFWFDLAGTYGKANFGGGDCENDPRSHIL